MFFIEDNYFDNPSYIRNYAVTEVEYNPPSDNCGWRGYRSEKLSKTNSIEEEVILKIYSTLERKLNRRIKTCDVFFHCSPKKIMNEEVDFHETKWHEDPSDFAGIIYLTPNPPDNTGTCINGHGCIENRYNRLLAYSGNSLHGPDNLFGDDVTSTRLTVTFFAWF